MYTKGDSVLQVALALIASITLLIGCASRKDTISQAERTESAARNHLLAHRDTTGPLLAAGATFRLGCDISARPATDALAFG